MNEKSNQDPSETLQALRKKIDAADQALLSALGTRFQLVQELGILKQAHDLPIYQPARWEEVVEARVQQGNQLGLNEAFTRSLLNLIHEEAIRIQQKNTP